MKSVVSNTGLLERPTGLLHKPMETVTCVLLEPKYVSWPLFFKNLFNQIMNNWTPGFQGCLPDWQLFKGLS